MAQLRCSSGGNLGGKRKHNHLTFAVLRRWILLWTILLLLHHYRPLYRRSHPSYPSYPSTAEALAFEAKTAAVRPVWFSSEGYYSRGEFAATGEQQQQQEPPQLSKPRLIFLHGRLEAEDSEPPFAEPAQLYFDFCCGLAEKIERHDRRRTRRRTTTTTTLSPRGEGEENDNHDNNNNNDAPKPENQPPSVLMLEYDDLLSKELPREPRDLSLGPISTRLAEAISQAVPASEETTAEHRNQQQQQQQQLVLVSFSMGAAMALKLLDDNRKTSNNVLRHKITHVVLIEPVWRCWLPFACGPIFQTDGENIATLAIRGTADDQTHVDSWGNLKASLGPLLPNIQTHTIKGGNHWGILSESVAGDIAREGMGKIIRPSSSNGGGGEESSRMVMTPELWKAETIDVVASFCGWDS